MLEGSPYIVAITDDRVIWKKNFMNEFCAAYDQGVPAKHFLKEHGIDPDILGNGRVTHFRVYYHRNWKPLHAPIEVTNGTQSKAMSSGTKLTRLEHDVAFLTQEVEYLKKIFIADNKQFAETRRLRKSAK